MYWFLNKFYDLLSFDEDGLHIVLTNKKGYIIEIGMIQFNSNFSLMSNFYPVNISSCSLMFYLQA